MAKTPYRPQNRRCAKCVWSMKFDNQPACGYLLYTGKMRGCPGGDDCTKFTQLKRGQRKPKIPALDEAFIDERLYRQEE